MMWSSNISSYKEVTAHCGANSRQAGHWGTVNKAVTVVADHLKSVGF